MAHNNFIRNTPISFIPKPFPNEIFIEVNENYYTGVKPYYLVSSFGRVFNKYSGEFILVDVSIDNKKFGGGNPRYYTTLQFTMPDGRTQGKKVSITRLMMVSFNYIKGCENLEVDHIDGVFYHNYLPNLEWVTTAENRRRAKMKNINGVIGKDQNYKTVITDHVVHNICKLIVDGYSDDAISIMLDVSPVSVKNIRLKRSWKNITKYYNLDRKGE